MERAANGVILECVVGDITDQVGFDAVVNAANARLEPGGGVAGAIHRAAGPELVAECRQLAPIKPGQAVITRGYGLPNSHVIHCLGPVYGVDMPSDWLLADCYRNALALAEDNGLSSVAFPALSTGIFGYPIEEAAEVAVATVIEETASLASVRVVRFVLRDETALLAHERVLSRLTT